jgi:organic hydroperoxide reductase OsmC/OhrA
LQHQYQANVSWTGARHGTTASYKSYSREFTVSGEGKSPLVCSSDPMFRGDPSLYNPEDLFISMISSCHMLWYLHLCADAGIHVISYADQISATMEFEPDGGGRFVEAQLNPVVVISDEAQIAAAEALHADAHKKCFLANSVNFPVRYVAEISIK